MDILIFSIIVLVSIRASLMGFLYWFFFKSKYGKRIDAEKWDKK